MRPAETIAHLDGFSGRRAGTDAERRAAVWLCRQLDGGAERAARLEPFWCRPNWALAQSWHIALAVAGSLLGVGSPRIGAALLLGALLLVIADAATGVSLGRLLTRERASQNVVLEASPASSRPNRVHLVITANYDAGGCGLVYRNGLRRVAAWMARATGGFTMGWLGWLCLALVWLVVVVVLRSGGSGGTVVDVLQLVPTVGLLLALVLLFEQATSRAGPAANDNGSGTAAAIALHRALDASPPRHLGIDLVLQGAGDVEGLGLHHYLRSRLKARRGSTVVLGLAACGVGEPRWWVSDGALLPLGYFKELRAMCAEIARNERAGAAPHRGRGQTPAFCARLARLPAIALGTLDSYGLAPRSHQQVDTPAAIDGAAIDRTVEFALLLVDRIDAFLASHARLTTPA